MQQERVMSGLMTASSAKDRNAIGVTVGLIALVLVGCVAIAESAWAVMAGFTLLYLLSFTVVLRWPKSAALTSLVETVVVTLAVVALGK